MTTSIVFDETMTCLDISYNSDTTFNYTDDGKWLTDPTAPRDALQRLRFLKVKETGDQIVIPDIIGRDTGQNIDFTLYSYDTLKMQRKATILQYNKKESQSQNKKQLYSQLAKTTKTKYKSMTNNRINALIESQNCENTTIIQKKSTNSGVKNGKTLLFLTKNVPYYSSI